MHRDLSIALELNQQFITMCVGTEACSYERSQSCVLCMLCI